MGLLDPLDDVPAEGALLRVVGGDADLPDLEAPAGVAEGAYHPGASKDLRRSLAWAELQFHQVDARVGIVGVFLDEGIEVLAIQGPAE